MISHLELEVDADHVVMSQRRRRRSFAEYFDLTGSAWRCEYHVPMHLDIPHIDVLFNDIPDALAPLGARGIGEIGVTGAATAVANAVFNATGKRIRELPITLDKLL